MKMKNKQSRKATQIKPKQPVSVDKKPKRQLRLPVLPVIPLLFVALYIWSSWYYGDVFRMAREKSFWVPSTERDGMLFLIQQQFGYLWYVGRMVLTLFRYPWLGGLLLALLLTFDTWCLGYVLRLNARWRFLQYIPLGIYMMMVSYEGVNTYMDNESGMIFGIPFLVAFVLGVVAVGIRCFFHKSTPSFIGKPKDEHGVDNALQWGAVVVLFGLNVWFTQTERPYTRPVAKEQLAVIEQDWQKVIDIAHDNDALSYRPLAASYAIALVHTDQLNERLYDIRLDFDSIYTHGRAGAKNDGTSLYLEDCNFHAGLVQSCIHQAIEHITMIGPNVHSLELLVKCHLLTSEWEVARKYLHILKDVPFEGDFVEKYSAMVDNEKMVNTDPEFAVVRLTEPTRDYFENAFQQPTFMGYNAQIMEGRSLNALYESIACCLYTKMMPGFMMRMKPLDGQATPTIVSDALCIMSNKNPDIMQHFPNLSYRKNGLISFLTAVADKLRPTDNKTSAQIRAENARSLFDTYKGYYPYYYYFGNLKATRKHTRHESSNVGVN